MGQQHGCKHRTQRAMRQGALFNRVVMAFNSANNSLSDDSRSGIAFLLGCEGFEIKREQAHPCRVAVKERLNVHLSHLHGMFRNQ